MQVQGTVRAESMFSKGLDSAEEEIQAKEESRAFHLLPGVLAWVRSTSKAIRLMSTLDRGSSLMSVIFAGAGWHDQRKGRFTEERWHA